MPLPPASCLPQVAADDWQVAGAQFGLPTTSDAARDAVVGKLPSAWMTSPPLGISVLGQIPSGQILSVQTYPSLH